LRVREQNAQQKSQTIVHDCPTIKDSFEIVNSERAERHVHRENTQGPLCIR
jgi:hypothetical protein